VCAVVCLCLVLRFGNALRVRRRVDGHYEKAALDSALDSALSACSQSTALVSAGCSTSATTRLAMNRAVRTAVPVLVTSLTSTMPRPVLTSTRRPARVAATS
jgi:hypothetical protein